MSRVRAILPGVLPFHCVLTGISGLASTLHRLCADLSGSVEMIKSWIPLFTAVAGLTLPGCFVGADHHGGDGLFTVEWSIDGRTRGDDCDYYGASSVYISVESRHGTEDYATVACDRFGYDFHLLPGDYWVEVTMLDNRDNDVSTTIRTDTYPLDEGESQYVVADFPGDSFR